MNLPSAAFALFMIFLTGVIVTTSADTTDQNKIGTKEDLVEKLRACDAVRESFIEEQCAYDNLMENMEKLGSDIVENPIKMLELLAGLNKIKSKCDLLREDSVRVMNDFLRVLDYTYSCPKCKKVAGLKVPVKYELTSFVAEYSGFRQELIAVIYGECNVIVAMMKKDLAGQDVKQNVTGEDLENLCSDTKGGIEQTPEKKYEEYRSGLNATIDGYNAIIAMMKEDPAVKHVEGLDSYIKRRIEQTPEDKYEELKRRLLFTRRKFSCAVGPLDCLVNLKTLARWGKVMYDWLDSLLKNPEVSDKEANK